MKTLRRLGLNVGDSVRLLARRVDGTAHDEPVTPEAEPELEAPVLAETSLSDASQRAVSPLLQAGLQATPVALTTVLAPGPNSARKRPRGTPRDGDEPEPAKSDKDRELARQLSALTAEINEAVRAGDRQRVVLLMRQREQLRSGKVHQQAMAVAPQPTQSIEPGTVAADSDGRRVRQSR